jgi:hypothetical protein
VAGLGDDDSMRWMPVQRRAAIEAA